MTKHGKPLAQGLPSHLTSGLDSIAGRVSYLIQHKHAGSVNAAAQNMRVPQRTLARIASGEVEHPRADALSAIASYYECDLAWLVTGKGEAPGVERKVNVGGVVLTGWAALMAERSFLRAGRIGRDLGLSAEEAQVLAYPGQLIEDASISLRQVLDGTKRKVFDLDFGRKLVELEVIWLDFLEQAIDKHGRDAVGSWVRNHRQEFARRFGRGDDRRKGKTTAKTKRAGG